METVTHAYTPRGVCTALLEDRSPEVLLSGPAGTGKSRACLEKVNLLCILNPGMRALIVRKTLASLGSTALVTWREHVIAEALAAGAVRFYSGSAQKPAMYEYANGSVVVVGGMDKATRIMSSEYDLIYVQEAIELDETSWEAITTRLRNGRVSFQQLIADTNPDAPTHWLKQRVDAGRTRMLDCRHEDNPRLFTPDGDLTPEGAVYIDRLDNLTGVRHDRLRHGRWVAAEGIIYEDWDQAVHLVDRFDIPDDWARWWSVDFGYTNPFVLQCWAEDPDGRLWLYREIYRTRTLVEDHARAILGTVTDATGAWTEPRPRAVICDHDAEDRATLERHLGISTTAAKKSVSDGIQAVQQRLRDAGDGNRRLYILRDSLHGVRDPELVNANLPASTVEEIAGYVWDIRAGQAPRETPVKSNDHGMDAMRYAVAHRDLVGRPNIRFL